MTGLLPSSMLLVHGPQKSDSVCLTFDDGPHPSLTPRVLDVLAEQGVKATFFVVGGEAQKHTDLVRRMTREGHTVAHHSYSHKRPEEMSASQLMQEIRETDTVLNQAASPPAKLFRPPWGKISLGKLWALWRKKLTVVLWNRDPKDFSGKSAQDLRQWLLISPLRGGDLVLLHDTVSATAEVLPEMILAARAAGLQFTTVDRWVGHS
jgi:peptidoglycan/xylan/chitin deacetylase (PgdA/CDA1 family)